MKNGFVTLHCYLLNTPVIHLNADGIEAMRWVQMDTNPHASKPNHTEVLMRSGARHFVRETVDEIHTLVMGD